MIELDLWFYAMAIPAVLFAGISKAGFGSGAAFAAAPFLALILEPASAIALMLPLLMTVDLVCLGPYWRKWDWPLARLIMIGMVPGVLVGWALFTMADADLLRLSIGVICLAFVAFQMAFSNTTIPAAKSQGAALALGGVGGFTSFVSHAGGPPVAMVLLWRGLDKLTYQATTVLAFWWVNLIKFPAYAASGLFTRDTAFAVVTLIPVAIIGAMIGVRLHKAVPTGAFFKVIYVFLTITGLKLIYDGWPA